MLIPKAHHSSGFKLFITALLMLTIFLSAVPMYGDNSDAHRLSQVAHIYEGGSVHTHMDTVYKIEVQDSLTASLTGQRSTWTAHYLFFLPESPTSLLDPPPEALLPSL